MSDLETMKLANVADRTEEFQLHPLGFFYIQDDADDGVTQRVHVWLPDSPDRPENDRHQHTFDIESLVMAGGMRSELFQFTQTPDGPDHEFAVSYEMQESVLSPTGKCGVLERIATFETKAGAHYRLEAGVIHRVVVTAKPCVTVVTTTEQGIPIYVYGSDEDEQPFERRTANPDEVSKITAVLADLLKS